MNNKYYVYHSFIDTNTLHTLDFIIKSNRADYLSLLDETIKFKVFPFKGVNYIYIYSSKLHFKCLDLNEFYLVRTHDKTN